MSLSGVIMVSAKVANVSVQQAIFTMTTLIDRNYQNSFVFALSFEFVNPAKVLKINSPFLYKKITN